MTSNAVHARAHLQHPSSILILVQTVLRLKAKDGKTPEDVAKVVKNLKPELTSSTNIGLADFYPATSGKEKAAQHIVQKFHSRLEDAFLLCDDDNDMGKLHLHTDTMYCDHHSCYLPDACTKECWCWSSFCPAKN